MAYIVRCNFGEHAADLQKGPGKEYMDGIRSIASNYLLRCTYDVVSDFV